MTNLVFFGTQEFGASILNSLISSENFKIAAVVTQPDRPAGRKQEIQKSPVKISAEKNNLPILQPATLKNYASQLPSTDFFVVCQYGLIIPSAILKLPPQGCINVHTSLLPKYRGASPIQSALIAGETATGVTIMYMDAQMDHGQILAQAPINISPDDTYSSLSQKMAPLAADLLLKTLKQILTKQIHPIIQDETKATYCKLLTRADGKIDFIKSAAELYNLYRGLSPWPGIWTTFGNKRLKILELKIADKNLKPGVIQIENKHWFIGTGEKAIEILKVQLEGKNPLSAAVFINGYPELAKTNLL